MKQPRAITCDSPSCSAYALLGFGVSRETRGHWACAVHEEEIRARAAGERTARLERAQIAQQPAQGRLW